MSHTRDAMAVDPREVMLEETAAVLANAPWWLISAGIHVILVLAAGLVYVESLRGTDDGSFQITVGPPDRTLPPVVPPPVDTNGFVRAPLRSDDGPALPADDPPIFFPGAELGPRNQTDDNEPYGKMKGESTAFRSYQPGTAGGLRGTQPDSKYAGMDGVIGPGPGGGSAGRFGGRLGGNKNMVSWGPGGGSDRERKAVIDALRWLARHQNEDGSWDGDGFGGRCGRPGPGPCNGAGYPEYDTGLTGLSLLAFLGAGYTHLSRDVYDGVCFGEAVKKGLRWLMDNQDTEGCVGGRSASKYMYNHAIAALALSEAYGMTDSFRLKGPAQKAIDFLVAAQNPYQGWRYTARAGDNDTSVTGWAVMALKSGELSNLAVPRASYEGARGWLDAVTAADHDVGYTDKDSVGPVVVQGKNESFADHDALVAIAVMSRIFIDKNRSDPRLKGGAERLVKDLPAWDGPKTDFYYWYYGSLALFQYDGPKGPMWCAWNQRMKEALVPHQRPAKDGCAAGSWDPVDRWGFEGGRVYATALNALTLEVYYRYENVFGVK